MNDIRRFLYGFGIVALVIVCLRGVNWLSWAFAFPPLLHAIGILVIPAALIAGIAVTLKEQRPNRAVLLPLVIGGCSEVALWGAFAAWHHGQDMQWFLKFTVLHPSLGSIVFLPVGETAALRLRLVSAPHTQAERKAARQLFGADRAGTICVWVIAVLMVLATPFAGPLAVLFGVTLISVPCAVAAFRERGILSEATTEFFRASA